jgi:hypothetical protein
LDNPSGIDDLGLRPKDQVVRRLGGHLNLGEPVVDNALPGGKEPTHLCRIQADGQRIAPTPLGIVQSQVRVIRPLHGDRDLLDEIRVFDGSGLILKDKPMGLTAPPFQDDGRWLARDKGGLVWQEGWIPRGRDLH